MTTEQVIQTQLEAYNQRDLTTFASLHAEDVQLYNYGEDTPFLKGRTKVLEVYGDVFNNSPTLHSKLINRIVFDNKVIDHEIISGRKGVPTFELIALYEIENSLIKKVTFIRK